MLGTLNAADADLRFNDPLAIETVIGRDIVGVHGLEGGAILQANDDGEYSKYEFGQDDMPPGRYKLSMIWGDYTTGKITLNDLHAFAVRLRWRSEDNLEDTVKHAQAEYAVADLSSGVFYQTAPSMDALGSMPQEFYFDLPADPTAVVTGSITEDPGSIADTTSFLLGSPTPTLVIANAKAQGIVPGAKARVRITKDMPAGAWATAEVVGLNSSGEALVEITLHNESGGAWVPGSLTAFVWIEVDYQADLGGYRSAPMGQWIWGVRASISKSTTTKVTMSKLEMIKVG